MVEDGLYMDGGGFMWVFKNGRMFDTDTGASWPAGEVEEDCGPLVFVSHKQTHEVNHPVHYTSHPSGVECITITEHMGFLDGNVLKYLWRFSLKGGMKDLEKCKWYLERLIEKEKA